MQLVALVYLGVKLSASAGVQQRLLVAPAGNQLLLIVK